MPRFLKCFIKASASVEEANAIKTWFNTSTGSSSSVVLALFNGCLFFRFLAAKNFLLLEKVFNWGWWLEVVSVLFTHAKQFGEKIQTLFPIHTVTLGFFLKNAEGESSLLEGKIDSIVIDHRVF